MTGADGTNGLANGYVYNADGKRTRRSIDSGGAVWWHVYGIGGELVAEYRIVGGAPTLKKEYGYRNGELLVVWDGDEAGDKRWQWRVTDQLGTARMLVDLSGSFGTIKRRDYLPFGEEVLAGVGHRTIGNGYPGMLAANPRQHFTGYERDNESGLDYAQARYYASTQGKFTSPDQPFVDQNEDNPQSWNLYAYVRNNPLKYSDPEGDSCYYSESGTLIGCDGDKRIRVEGERLYFTPKKGSKPLVYDLNKLKVQEEISDRACNCKPIPTEAQFARALFTLWGGAVVIGATGGAVAYAGGITLGGSSITTLGLPAGPVTPLPVAIGTELSKAAAREAIEQMGLSEAAKAAARRALMRAAANQKINILRGAAGEVIVRVYRQGYDGFQVIETIIDSAGNKRVIQQAVDALGRLVHWDPKK
ncbi:MAG: RHS repeat-associated core domain-containing protein, partial [Blastocatellales bacterium]|nr:RHS repeat-associated core domain-containing protein [Blastocatellales bacterium]